MNNFKIVFKDGTEIDIEADFYSADNNNNMYYCRFYKETPNPKKGWLENKVLLHEVVTLFTRPKYIITT